MDDPIEEAGPQIQFNQNGIVVKISPTFLSVRRYDSAQAKATGPVFPVMINDVSLSNTFEQPGAKVLDLTKCTVQVDEKVKMNMVQLQGEGKEEVLSVWQMQSAKSPNLLDEREKAKRFTINPHRLLKGIIIDKGGSNVTPRTAPGDLSAQAIPAARIDLNPMSMDTATADNDDSDL